MYGQIYSAVDANGKAQCVLNTRKLIMSWNTFQANLELFCCLDQMLQAVGGGWRQQGDWRSLCDSKAPRDTSLTGGTLVAGCKLVHNCLSPFLLGKGFSMLLRSLLSITSATFYRRVQKPRRANSYWEKIQGYHSNLDSDEQRPANAELCPQHLLLPETPFCRVTLSLHIGSESLSYWTMG